jgi:hypothetical protein
MIDPATGWFEIVEATNSSATSIKDLFHIMGKFKREFKQMCDNYGIKAKPTTSDIIPSTSKCND